MTARVVVVPSRFGGVLGEIAGWLAESVGGVLCPSDAPGVIDGQTVILVGAGVEFDAVLGRLAKAVTRPTVLLWAFDAFPPPGTSAEVAAKGLRAGRWTHRIRQLDGALGQPFGGAGKGGATKRALRRLVLHGLGGRAELAGRNEFADGVITSAAYERLFWLTHACEQRFIDRVLVSSPHAAPSLSSRDGILSPLPSTSLRKPSPHI